MAKKIILTTGLLAFSTGVFYFVIAKIDPEHYMNVPIWKAMLRSLFIVGPAVLISLNLEWISQKLKIKNQKG
ncbi:MAG: hypothetical protein R3C61_19575 [Bacteroidia bacterium]